MCPARAPRSPPPWCPASSDRSPEGHVHAPRSHSRSSSWRPITTPPMPEPPLPLVARAFTRLLHRVVLQCSRNTKSMASLGGAKEVQHGRSRGGALGTCSGSRSVPATSVGSARRRRPGSARHLLSPRRSALTWSGLLRSWQSKWDPKVCMAQIWSSDEARCGELLQHPTLATSAPPRCSSPT
jgi:hypothetical protein